MSEPQWQTCPKCGERWWDSHVCRNTLNSLTVALAPTCRFCGQAARAQPAQAGHVPEASCGECGKKASDGWALYCVACMEEAGLPAVTDSPPLMHPCTSSLGKTPDSTAQAVPLLSDAEIVACRKAQVGRYGTVDPTKPYSDSIAFGRAIESAVRAKLGAAAPMTDPHLQTSEERRATGERIASMIRVEEVGADLIRRARDIVVGHQRGSISLVQRRLQISYNTAAKLLEALEQEGVVSPQRQNGQREVLVLPDISGIVGKEGA